MLDILRYFILYVMDYLEYIYKSKFCLFSFDYETNEKLKPLQYLQIT